MGNFGTIVAQCQDSCWGSFQTLQQDSAQRTQNHINKISQKIIFGANCIILAHLLFEPMQACASWYARRILWNFAILQYHRAQWIHENQLSESFQKLILGQMGNFSLILSKTYTIFYLRMCSKNLFQTLLHDRRH